MKKLTFIIFFLVTVLIGYLAITMYQQGTLVFVGPSITVTATAKPSACQIAKDKYEDYEGEGLRKADLLDAYQQACGLGPYSLTAGESCDADSAAEQDLSASS